MPRPLSSLQSQAQHHQRVCSALTAAGSSSAGAAPLTPRNSNERTLFEMQSGESSQCDNFVAFSHANSHTHTSSCCCWLR
jgi:hypothetical protein